MAGRPPPGYLKSAAVAGAATPTDRPAIEAMAFRGLLFAALVATPFWLVVAALAAWMLL